MRIVCPACAAAYDVPPALLRPRGRLVRCARCGGEWVPDEGADADAAHAEVFAPRPEDDTMPAPPASPARGAPVPRLAAEGPLGTPQPRAPTDGAPRGAVAAGWIGTVLILAAAAAGAYAWRPHIEAAWPASQRAYAMLGLP